MNLLVMAPEPVDADTVRNALGGEDLGDAKILYVAPALQGSGLKFLVSDEEGISAANANAEQTEDALRDEGLQATGTAGESEPLLALQDALATFQADRILVFVREDDDQAYREDDVVGEAERRFGVPVTQARL